MVELILRESVEHLGRRGEIVSVANGYARNYLLPRKLALRVTDANRHYVAREREAAEALEAEERQAAEVLANRVSALDCVIARRVGETETLYGSVTSADIAEYLASQELPIDKREIQLADPIKELGEVTVPIKIHRDVTASLRVRVVPEEVEEGADPKVT